VIFHNSPIECAKINAKSNMISDFSNRNLFGNPFRILDRKYDSILQEFSNSFRIVASSVGLIGLHFFLTSFMPSFMGMACCIREGSKP
jgi:hypothetical protein